ncbi:hypothetical protein [Streptomyces mirabilis]|uniref:hypothetical protein n=1 Tax=Streptomyces mirabilis TaxID=68239 RepID=UPI003683C946
MAPESHAALRPPAEPSTAERSGYGEIGYFFMESGGECGRWPSLAMFTENLAGAIEDITKMRDCLPSVKDDALSWD